MTFAFVHQLKLKVTGLQVYAAFMSVTSTLSDLCGGASFPACLQIVPICHSVAFSCEKVHSVSP